ncbi:MAG TPA: N-6 DNA methylase [Candidatus Faecousia intestinigallinarum]|nr:N-6 DNA methylase [Candidatus Faecousia intestinigallinarum]
MPSIIDDDQLKKKCQVFTPTDIVDYMLDMAIYNDGLYGKSFLENSCGDGQILVRIVDRYISDCKLHGLHTDLIKSGLENDIVAYDIDPQMVACTQQKLDALALQNGFTSVKWDIRNADFLSDDSQKKYDYIFGNPPYISYADLPAESRKYLRQNFSSCKKGKFDYS